MPLDVAGFAHVNLNCADLARSRRFYEDAFGLRAVVHTNPEPQDCSAFGLSEPGQWDAWMLTHEGIPAGCAIDLLEWRRPRPVGAPDAEPGRLGLRALGFEVPDLDVARARIATLGGRASAPEAQLALAGAKPARVCAGLDPDGVPLWLRAASRPRLAFVELACSDLERSLGFLREVLGMESASPQETESVPGAGLGLEAPARWSAEALALPGDPEGFRVALTRWERPAPHGRPPAEPHRLGLYRMALLVRDLDRSHRELRSLGVAGLTAPVSLELGPACPAPRCRALFFRDPDGACLELIEVPESPPDATPPRVPA
jgi:catechol 2,3-dioxygenase-like lactoylglutathione lyase family enzyme